MILINWEAVEAIAAWVEIVAIIFPAIFYFLYSKISYLSIWIMDNSKNGMKLALHNKTKISLFILNKEIIVQRKYEKYNYTISEQTSNPKACDIIKPDEIIYITIDYNKYNILNSDKIKLKIQFGGKLKTYQKKLRRG